MHQLNALESLVKNSVENFPLPPLLVHSKYLLPVNAFSETLELKRSLVEGQQLQKKKKQEEEKKEKRKKKKEKPKVVGWLILQKLSQNFVLCARPSKKVIKHDSGEMQRLF